MSLAEGPTSEQRSLPQPHWDHAAVAVAGNELTLYEESISFIDAMLADIRTARQRVWLESYIIVDDSAARAVADALIERAAAGLDVRLMYDSIGCLSTPQSFFDRLTAGGVKVHGFHSIRERLWDIRLLQFLNRRNHRKLLVVDDRVGYFGGMNLVDQRGLATPSDAKARHLPASAGWRDLHVRLVGPKQAEIAREMERLWQWKTRQPITAPAAWPLRQLLAAERDDIFFFASRPSRHSRRIGRVIGPLIRGAQREIIVSMAYFIPIGAVMRELLRARRRGVRVRVVVPGNSDVKLVQWATRHLCRRLLARGILIFERKDYMLHSKVIVIDGVRTIVGSANLDPRSLRTNLEFVGVIFSQAMAAAATRFCLHEIHHSRRIRLVEIRSRPWWQRVRDRFAWSLRRWL
ncbi:MAG TPA: phospholipase D-like domain-containing protein [Pirellulales bacterium]|jgi:cardiolipin synthase|nr:phospholipase D-like domain-containing protein [Pirellulales bacterium]